MLANSAVTHPDYPELLNAILSKIMEFWLNEQYPERRVSRIYAQAVSEQGSIIAKKLYLGPLYIIEDGKLMRVKDWTALAVPVLVRWLPVRRCS